MERIRNNPVDFDPAQLVLSYQSGQQRYELTFGKDFKINGQVTDTRYRRFDSPYVQGDKKDRNFTFSMNGRSLFLEFDSMTRIIE